MRYCTALLTAVAVLGCTTPPVMSQSARSTVADLPLTWLPPTAPSKRVTAVLLTGDGGWAELIRSVAEGLAAQGIAVVGFNSRAWLSKVRTPESTAAAIARVLTVADREWPADHIVLVGYSRGADFVPFVANRLPPAQSAKLAGLAMFGMAPMASFEFHWTDLVKDTRRETDVAILPELEKLRGTRMVCVYGSDEETSGCRDAASDLVVKDERGGGHHFDGNCDALVQHVLDLLSPLPLKSLTGSGAHRDPPAHSLCPGPH